MASKVCRVVDHAEGWGVGQATYQSETMRAPDLISWPSHLWQITKEVMRVVG